MAAISVHPEVTFHQLHKIIQFVMGWENYHLYEFCIDGHVIALPDPTYEDMEDREVLNARRETVYSHLKKENTIFTYTYDFGDHWVHTITLEKTNSSSITDVAPICLNGARSCPQEDVGGIGGHQHMMTVLVTPNHPERERFTEWLKDGFDPEYFSCEEVNIC